MKLQLIDSRAPDATPKALEVRRGPHGLEVILEGRTLSVEGGYVSPGVLQLHIEGRPLRLLTASRGDERLLARGGKQYSLQKVDPAHTRRRARADVHASGDVTSNMPGLVLKVMVQEGDHVSRGQGLLLLEAMKMEHELKAPRDGVVKKISCTAGQMVAPGVTLVEVVAS